MIDTHCHLLPGLDDGAVSELEAVQLARQLVGDGVTYVLCTPHFSRAFPTSSERAAAARDRLSEQLEALSIPLPLGVAAEVNMDLLEDAARNPDGRSIDGRRLMVELNSGTPAAAVAAALETLRERGLLPVFAHPERCRAVRQETTLIANARVAGALFQVVAPSLAGRWGEEVETAAWSLLDEGHVDLVASDAHRPSARGTLAEVLGRIGDTYGGDALRELTEMQPSRMLGRVVAPDVPARGGDS